MILQKNQKHVKYALRVKFQRYRLLVKRELQLKSPTTIWGTSLDQDQETLIIEQTMLCNLVFLLPIYTLQLIQWFLCSKVDELNINTRLQERQHDVILKFLARTGLFVWRPDTRVILGEEPAPEVTWG